MESSGRGRIGILKSCVRRLVPIRKTLLVWTDDRTVEASAVGGVDGNHAGGVWRAVGGERRPALQIRGGLDDVIQVGLSRQQELKLTTRPGRYAQLRHWNKRELKNCSRNEIALRRGGRT